MKVLAHTIHLLIKRYKRVYLCMRVYSLCAQVVFPCCTTRSCSFTIEHLNEAAKYKMKEERAKAKKRPK